MRAPSKVDIGGVPMGQKDQQIVKLLRQNARLSYSEIGAQIGLSRTAVRNRISALENSGILAGYHAVVNMQNTSRAVTFLVTIETEPAHFAEVWDALIGENHAVTVAQTTGECHLLASCVAADRQDLRDFLNRALRRGAWYPKRPCPHGSGCIKRFPAA